MGDELAGLAPIFALVVGCVVVVAILALRTRKAAAMAAIDPVDRLELLEHLRRAILAVQGAIDLWPQAFVTGDPSVPSAALPELHALRALLKTHGDFGWHQMPDLWASLSDAVDNFVNAADVFAQSRREKVPAWRGRYFEESQDWWQRGLGNWAKATRLWAHGVSRPDVFTPHESAAPVRSEEE